MLDDTAAGPFGRAAQLYRDAGWQGTLPLGPRPGMKSPPPKGWTGHGAPYPSGADVAAWADDFGDRNIGIRMPDGVIGLDIDAGYVKDGILKRGDESLAALEARLGPLPPTWVSSARPAPSGIRWFRVPAGSVFPGEAAKFIEIIQAGHRFAVVWPSTNPDADGAPYRWRSPDGAEVDDVPHPATLTPLPAAWVEGLARTEAVAGKADLTGGAQGAYLSAMREGDPCPVVTVTRDKYLNALVTDAGSRHEVARDGLSALVRLGGEGHRGARAAAAALAAAFTEAVGEARAVQGGELSRLAEGAVNLAAKANPQPLQMCAHDIPEATVVPDGEVLAGFMTPSAGAPVAPPATVATAEGSATIVDQLILRIEQVPAGAERDALVRAAAGELVEQQVDEVSVQRARAALTTKSGMSGVGLTEFADLLREARRARKEALAHQQQLAAHAEAQGRIELRRAEGTLLPPPHEPVDVARHLVTSLPAPARWWRGDFYRWDGTRYIEWRADSVDNFLYRETADAWFEGPDDRGPVKWRPSETRIGAVAHALARGVLHREGGIEPDDEPSQVACSNGVYDVVTGELLPHTPERFNLLAVPFAFDPAATAPSWAKFLDEVLPADAQRFLQEWFGYVLSGRTDLEKIANLVGPPRSGKGTIATVLEALVGGESVSSPSMPSLVGNFGEQPLIGKTLAIFSDISWKHRDIVAGVEILKAISGQDTRDVNRKNRDIWHGKLGVRFMIMGNDMPTFTDASGALAGRMIHVEFTRSVAGREDPGLKPRLLLELPGVLNWALEGLRRLAGNGRFTVPQSSEELAGEVRRQQSPVQGFLDDCCTFSEGVNPVPLDELYPVYRAWARGADVGMPLDRERFSRALRSAGLIIERKMVDGTRARRVHGIAPAGVTAWSMLLNPGWQPVTAVEPPPGFEPPAR